MKESKTEGETFTEALSINKSLLTLGQCISILSDPKKRNSGSHVPFRDSKLTRLLAESLGGQGLALMIGCVSPSSASLQETIKTLRYASRARKIENKPVIQLSEKEEAVIILKREINGLKKENAALRKLVENDSRFSGVSMNHLITSNMQEDKLFKSKNSPETSRGRSHSRTHSTSTSASKSRAYSTTNSNFGSSVFSPSKVSTTFSSSARKKTVSQSSPSSPQRPRERSKSVSRQRVDNLKRSDAPAGSEKVTTILPYGKKGRSASEVKDTPHSAPSVMKKAPTPTTLPKPRPTRRVNPIDRQEIVDHQRFDKQQLLNDVHALDREIQKIQSS